MDVVFKTEKAVFNYRVAGIWIVNGRILLHRDTNDTSWSLPGGRVQLTENSGMALKREFLEELNIEVEIGVMHWFVENFFAYKGNDFHEIGLYYAVSSDNNTMPNKLEAFYGAEGERLMYEWVSIEKLQEMELYPAFLRTALQKLPVHTAHVVVKQ